MTTFIAIASRLFAIYLVLTAIRFSSYVLLGFDIDGSAMTLLWVSILGVILPLGVAAFLWRKPLVVARALVPSGSDTLGDPEISESGLYSVLLAILGLYLTVTGGAALAGSLVEYIVLANSSFSVEGLPLSRWSALVASALEFGLGVVLLLRIRGMKKLYFWLKHGGLNHESPDN